MSLSYLGTIERWKDRYFYLDTHSNHNDNRLPGYCGKIKENTVYLGTSVEELINDGSRSET